jgi:hypothetical protein
MNKRWMIGVVLAVLVLASLACNFNASTANIKDVKLAKDTDGAQPTTVFGVEDTFYCLATLANAPDDTVVKAVWTAVEVADNDPNLKLDEASLTHGDGVLTFNLTNSGPWPTGKYKVDLYLNDKLEKTVEFMVE